jgi:hypothetical protein
MSIQLLDGLMAWDTERQRQEQIAEIERDIRSIGRRCGDCNNWMKSRQCPRERNVGGMSRGPSCESLICPSFEIASSATRRKADLEVRLTKIKGEG